jgi:hypothetical protein
VAPLAVVLVDESRGARARGGLGGEPFEAAQLDSSVECQLSMTALSSADPTRPIDWRMPIRVQAARKLAAVYSLPWSVCNTTPATASRPPRTATAMTSEA